MLEGRRGHATAAGRNREALISIMWLTGSVHLLSSGLLLNFLVWLNSSVAPPTTVLAPNGDANELARQLGLVWSNSVIRKDIIGSPNLFLASLRTHTHTLQHTHTLAKLASQCRKLLHESLKADKAPSDPNKDEGTHRTRLADSLASPESNQKTRFSVHPSVRLLLSPPHQE